jgi:hypothetical protein
MTSSTWECLCENENAPFTIKLFRNALKYALNTVYALVVWISQFYCSLIQYRIVYNNSEALSSYYFEQEF